MKLSEKMESKFGTNSASLRMEAEVYEDIVVSIRSRGWGDLDTLQEEICQEFPEAASQSVKSILHQASFYQKLAELKNIVSRVDYFRRINVMSSQLSEQSTVIATRAQYIRGKG